MSVSKNRQTLRTAAKAGYLILALAVSLSLSGLLAA
jgi:hypothetical protein